MIFWLRDIITFGLRKISLCPNWKICMDWLGNLGAYCTSSGILGVQCHMLFWGMRGRVLDFYIWNNLSKSKGQRYSTILEHKVKFLDGLWISSNSVHTSSDCTSNTTVLIHHSVSESGMSINHHPFDMTFMWKSWVVLPCFFWQKLNKWLLLILVQLMH